MFFLLCFLCPGLALSGGVGPHLLGIISEGVGEVVHFVDGASEVVSVSICGIGHVLSCVILWLLLLVFWSKFFFIYVLGFRSFLVENLATKGLSYSLTW